MYEAFSSVRDLVKIPCVTENVNAVLSYCLGSFSLSMTVVLLNNPVPLPVHSRNFGTNIFFQHADELRDAGAHELLEGADKS